jgi:CRP-like cAMP-binding protein
VPGRLAKKLLELAEKYGRPAPQGTIIRLRLTQRDLASMIGATRESVNKHLQSFRAQGMISVDGRSISVRDTEKLQRRAH